jgi:hypothetical protein
MNFDLITMVFITDETAYLLSNSANKDNVIKSHYER